MTLEKRRLPRSDAEERYIRAGELEVFRQLQRDGQALEQSLSRSQAFAVGPFARVRSDALVDELGRTRGAINNLWGSQEAFRAAVMATFLNDTGLGLSEVRYPEPSDAPDLDSWIDALARVEIERGPHHGMRPENRYGLRWAAWLGLVPYGIWSETVAQASLDEYRLGAERYGDQILAPALRHFGRTLIPPTTVHDLAVAACSVVEGFWLNACLSSKDPLGRSGSICNSLATTLRLLIRGATVRAEPGP
jgi:hypothetical protein